MSKLRRSCLDSFFLFTPRSVSTTLYFLFFLRLLFNLISLFFFYLHPYFGGLDFSFLLKLFYWKITWFFSMNYLLNWLKWFIQNSSVFITILTNHPHSKGYHLYQKYILKKSTILIWFYTSRLEASQAVS